MPLLLELASSAEPETALAAAHSLLKVSHLHAAAAAAELASPDTAALLVSLLEAGATAPPQGSAERRSPERRQRPQADSQQVQHPARPTFPTDIAPLLLLATAAVVEARPDLLRQHGAALRPAVAACLAAVGDPGLKRRWAGLLARAA